MNIVENLLVFMIIVENLLSYPVMPTYLQGVNNGNKFPVISSIILFMVRLVSLYILASCNNIPPIPCLIASVHTTKSLKKFAIFNIGVVVSNYVNPWKLSSHLANQIKLVYFLWRDVIG